MPNGRLELKTLAQPGFTFGNFLEITCDRGFKVVGNNIIICNASGLWDSTLPICRSGTEISNILKLYHIVFFLANTSRLCTSRPVCPAGKECIVTSRGKAKCVCSASLGHDCISTPKPICTSEDLTFWSECDMMNYSCLHPHKQLTILRYSACNEGPITKMTITTNRGIESRYVYKCSLPQKVGPCKARVPRFYFDQDTNRCTVYDWGGCDANGNNFDSLQQCRKDCRGWICLFY